MAQDLPGQIGAACELAYNRTPSAEERREFTDYAGRHGLAAFCRVLFNSSEFAFLP